VENTCVCAPITNCRGQKKKGGLCARAARMHTTNLKIFQATPPSLKLRDLGALIL
jgi:hypothetical protein